MCFCFDYLIFLNLLIIGRAAKKHEDYKDYDLANI